ncbi:MAG: VWA-like domain-containing protein [Thermoprotei archaeon]
MSEYDAYIELAPRIEKASELTFSFIIAKILHILKYRWATDVSTAATDGSTLYVNRDFYNILPPKQQSFVLLHELFHTILLHPWHIGTKVGCLWNCAGDFIINSYLIENFVKTSSPNPELVIEPPPGILYDPKYSSKQYTTESLYNLFLTEWLNGRPIPCPCPPPGGGEGEGGQPPGEEEGEGGGEGEGGQPQHPRKLEGGGGFDPGKGGDIIRGRPEDFDKIADEVSSYGSGAYGSGTAGERAFIEAEYKSMVDWQSILERYVTRISYTDYRMPPFKRGELYIPRVIGIEQPEWLYLPTLSQRTIKIVIAIDTSGSIEEVAYTVFIHEMLRIVNMPNVRGTLIFCYKEITYVNDFPPAPFTSDFAAHIKTGGTDFRPVFKYIQDNLNNDIDLLIYLTDLFGPFPKQQPPYQVLWATITPPEKLKEEKIKVPFGDILYIPI